MLNNQKIFREKHMPTIKTNTTNLVLHNKVKNIYNLNSTTNKYKNK